jgi:hypothetical protein
VPLKNQALPPDTGKGVLKESSPASTMFFFAGVLVLENLTPADLAKPGSFS